MGEYIAIDGHPTWIEVAGQGDPVLLLHGGFSNCDGLRDVFAPLGAEYRLIAFDRRGHGRTADTDADFHYRDMAAETIAVLEYEGGEAAHLVGFSDGGIIVLFVALVRPELVRSIVLIGTNYHFDGVVPAAFDDLGPESEFVAFLLPGYAERSPDGADHFPVVVAKGAAMISREPTLSTSELSRITVPALVMVGDDDAVLPMHTWSLYESLPAGQLAVVPGWIPRGSVRETRTGRKLVADFLHAGSEVSTMLPLRRA